MKDNVKVVRLFSNGSSGNDSFSYSNSCKREKNTWSKTWNLHIRIATDTI